MEEPHADPQPTIEERWPAHPSVDLSQPDPCDVEGRAKRQCVSATKAGERCTAPAVTDEQRCLAHLGRLDASAGQRARAERLARDKREAQKQAAERTLGARAALQQEFHDRSALLAATARTLLEAASEGDLQAAKALPAFLNQAFGMPQQTTEAEVQVTHLGQVEGLSDEELQALLGRTQVPPSAQ